MSGTSIWDRPRRNASKKRGGSKIRSSTLSALFPLRRMSSAPSPSTRASVSTLIVRVLAFMTLALLAEGLGVGIEGSEHTHETSRRNVGREKGSAERRRVRRLHGAEAAAGVARAERTAARVRDGTQARRAVRDHDSDISLELALDAHAMRGDVRLAPVQERPDHLEELALVDGTAAKLELDRHVLGDRSRRREGVDVLGLRVDDGTELRDVSEVAESLDPTGGGARADGHEHLRDAAHLADALGVCGGRDRSFDDRQIVGAFEPLARGLDEVRDADGPCKRQQLVLAVEERELATVARRELPYSELRLAAHVRSPSCRRGERCDPNGARDRPCTRT